MKPRVVIVGAGLGGCMLAHGLLESHDVTLIERGTEPVDPRYPVVDVGRPAVTEPHFGTGLGGSTQLWHNGLIEIDEEIFATQWPLPKSALDPFYERAFPLLSGIQIGQVREAIEALRRLYVELGVPEGLLQGLYYPQWPRNVWKSLGLEGRVKIVRGDVVDFQTNAAGAIASLAAVEDGQQKQIDGDIFVLAAGGLGSPALLQKLAARLPLPGLRHAGCHYEDHPMGFVGEVEVTVPLYRLWNYRVPGTDGNLRLPFVVKRGGMHVSFQLRPAASYYRESRRERVGSVLNELRRNPWNPLHYLKLLRHWDDVLDILSFKFGIRLPTRNYTLLMCAQMPAAPELSIWGEEGVLKRRWQLSQDYQRDLGDSVRDVLAWLAPVTRRSREFPGWLDELRTGAHHSGTARMSEAAESGVCDADCRVHGLPNLYVCDGSLIPASGIANTGLTIAALALRLAEHLRSRTASYS
ncbi:GMC oxidoreductase [Roseateles violae]|uniref:GMC oxidoreductase n=1 Tax=Roseateles violae TaxID=3058042 RepID=A0ABT8DR10_9BURK|nr:GMC oxidoreductase [Pelomonas sp. PFR6]MDN3920468.1 GMC oxidoreductase [Pelomonas sp. PFR6]